MSTDLQSLKGRHALVCGASAGIGRAAAVAIARRGAHVTVLARRGDLLDSLEAEMREVGAAGTGQLVADLEDHEALGAAVDGLLQSDAGAVHVLVNNAGGPPGGPLLEAEATDILKAMQRHLFANHLLVRRCVPGMREAGYGRIINVISTSVYEPIPGLGVSNTVRGAVASWAKTISGELPPGITINNLLPGFTDTQRLGELGAGIAGRTGKSIEQVREGWLAQVPEGRLARPEEQGEVIAFMATPAAAYLRGQSVAVDGGRMRGI